MSTKTGSKIVLLWATKVYSPQLTQKQVRTVTITPWMAQAGSNLQLKEGFGIENQNYHQGSVSGLNQKVVSVVSYYSAVSVISLFVTEVEVGLENKGLDITDLS